MRKNNQEKASTRGNKTLHTEAASIGDDEKGTYLMSNPAYLRQSSALINEALQKGFDVLQLANGDVVTTGTKVVISTYSWDNERGKLVKSRSGRARRRGMAGQRAAELEDA